MSEFASIFERFRSGEVKPEPKDSEEGVALKARLKMALLRTSKPAKRQPGTMEPKVILKDSMGGPG